MLKGRLLLVADVIGRFCVCVYFTTVMLRRIAHASYIVAKDEWQSADVMTMASTSAVVLFLGMVCVVTLTRLPPIQSANGIEPYLTAMAGTFIVGLIAYLPEPAKPLFAVQLVATALIIVGMIASAYVIAWLGRAFSIMPEARTLITEGPYSVVRHPLYLAEEIGFIGIILMTLSAWSVCLGIVHWLLQTRRMVNEERVLRSAFPDYEAYSRVVPRVIPIRPADMQPSER